MKKLILENFTIQDDLSVQNNCAIEVVVHLKSGESRWCFFVTPVTLRKIGDWIEGTKINFSYGCEHMIIVSSYLTRDIIGQALKDIDGKGEILECTRIIKFSQ